MGRAGLHLDKDQHFAIAANQVKFIALIARTVPVARDNGKTAFALKKIRCHAFTGSAGASRGAESGGIGGDAIRKEGFKPGKHRKTMK